MTLPAPPPQPAALQASLLLALNFLPLFEGQNWQVSSVQRVMSGQLQERVQLAMLCWAQSAMPQWAIGSAMGHSEDTTACHAVHTAS